MKPSAASRGSVRTEMRLKGLKNGMLYRKGMPVLWCYRLYGHTGKTGDGMPVQTNSLPEKFLSGKP